MKNENKKSKELKTMLFTHDDLDGVSCGIVLESAKGIWLAYTNYMNYENINIDFRHFIESEEYKNFDLIFMTDISIKRDTELINLINSTIADKFVLLDHHKTAEWLNEYKWATVKTELNGRLTCGTELVFQYMKDNGLIDMNESIKMHFTDFVKLVRLYDTYDFKRIDKDNPDEVAMAKMAEDLNTFMQFVDIFEFDNIIIDNIYCEDAIITPDMYSIIDRLNKQKEEYISEKTIEFEYTNELFEGYCVALVYAEKYASEIGYRLNQKYDDMDFVAIVDPSKNTISLRSRDGGIDVGEVAKKYGGGGHKNAAGVKYSVMYPKFVFNP